MCRFGQRKGSLIGRVLDERGSGPKKIVGTVSATSGAQGIRVRRSFPSTRTTGRVRNLMDLMHQPQWIAAACDRVLQRSRGKAAGVDRVTASEFQQNRRANLEKLRLELKRGTYQPQPLRRVMIPKANGKLRGLGIPCLRDKIVQEAIRMALEPIYEVEFHDNSYGFRPNRSTHHAVLRCQQMMQKGFTWVIEGDVKACFDEISHKAILGCLREKVMDNKFLDSDRRLAEGGRELRWRCSSHREGRSARRCRFTVACPTWS